MFVKRKLLSVQKSLALSLSLVVMMSISSIGRSQVSGSGSCDLGELMEKFSDEKELINDIKVQMKAQKVRRASCGASLLYLADGSHSRVAPYEIGIGSKTLTIFSKIILLSESGQQLPDGAFDQAYDFEEINLTWEWK
jgi:hypothetical protein